jgi:opacity protein-like surface antigen
MGFRLFVIYRPDFYSHGKAEETMKELVAAFLVCSFTLSSSMALAQDTDSDKLNYLGVTAGGVFPRELDSDERYPDRIALSDVELRDGFMLGVRVGHTPKKLAIVGRVAIAIEVEAYMIGGADVEDERYYTHPFGSNVYLDADISVTAIMLNFLARDPYGQVHPYGGWGIGWTRFDAEDATLTLEPGYSWPAIGTRTNSLGDLDDDTLGFQVLLGVGVDLTRTLSLDLGYRYFYAQPELEFKREADIDVKMTYKTHMITVGLNLRF